MHVVVAICFIRIIDLNLIERLSQAINVRSLPLRLFRIQQSCSSKIQSDLSSCSSRNKVSRIVSMGPMVYYLVASSKKICWLCLWQKVSPGIAHRWSATVLVVFIWSSEIKICFLNIVFSLNSDSTYSSVWRLGSWFIWGFKFAGLPGSLHRSIVALVICGTVSLLLTFYVRINDPKSLIVFG